MITKNEVKLHQKSVDYMNQVFAHYTEIEHLDNPVRNPIIHLYPVEDTYDENGDLNGYNDAIFFRVDIYDTKNNTVQKGKGLHDAIVPYSDLIIRQIKIFKDLSTLLALKGEYNIDLTTAIGISKN